MAHHDSGGGNLVLPGNTWHFYFTWDGFDSNRWGEYDGGVPCNYEDFPTPLDAEIVSAPRPDSCFIGVGPVRPFATYASGLAKAAWTCRAARLPVVLRTRRLAPAGCPARPTSSVPDRRLRSMTPLRRTAKTSSLNCEPIPIYIRFYSRGSEYKLSGASQTSAIRFGDSVGHAEH